MRALVLLLVAGCADAFGGGEKGPAGGETDTDTDTDADSDTDADGDADTGWPDATGLASVYGEVNWYDVVGGYWDDEDFGDAWMQVGPPQAVSIADFYSPMIDRCASDFAGEVDFYADGDDEAVLNGLADARIRLAWNAERARYENDALRAEQFEAGSAYDLDTISIPSVPTFGVTEVARTGGPFEVTEPDIMGDTYLLARKDRMTFAWTGSGGDVMLVKLALWEADGVAPLEVVTCAAADDGAFMVPPEVWAAWAPDLQLDVFVGRAMTGRGTLDFDNSSTAMVGTWWVYGAMQTAE